jgi:Zn-dependent protease with chaperone function
VARREPLSAYHATELAAALDNFRGEFGRHPTLEEAAWFSDALRDQRVPGLCTPAMHHFMQAWIDAEFRQSWPSTRWERRALAMHESLSEQWRPRQAAAEERARRCLVRAGIPCTYGITALPMELGNAYLRKAHRLRPQTWCIAIPAGFTETLTDEELLGLILHEKHHGDAAVEHRRRERNARKGKVFHTRRVAVASVARNIELECDKAAIHGGVSPEAFVSMLLKLEARNISLGYQSSVGPRPVTASHPDLDTRILAVRPRPESVRL